MAQPYHSFYCRAWFNFSVFGIFKRIKLADRFENGQPQAPNEIAEVIGMNQKTVQMALMELVGTNPDVKWKKIGNTAISQVPRTRDTRIERLPPESQWEERINRP